MTRELDAPAVYLSRRFWADFGAATILATGLGWFFGIPAAPLVGGLVGGISAWQAQRPRVRDEAAWTQAVLADAETRRIAKASRDVGRGVEAGRLKER